MPITLDGTNGATFYITGVQLEVGSTATSFDYRPYGTELALCQRYYSVLNGAYNTCFGSGISTGGTTASIFVKYPTTMRASPTATANNLGVTNQSSYNGLVSSLSGSVLGTDTALINPTHAGGGTNLQAAMLITYSGGTATSGSLTFSAEL